MQKFRYYFMVIWVDYFNRNDPFTSKFRIEKRNCIPHFKSISDALHLEYPKFCSIFACSYSKLMCILLFLRKRLFEITSFSIPTQNLDCKLFWWELEIMSRPWDLYQQSMRTNYYTNASWPKSWIYKMWLT